MPLPCVVPVEDEAGLHRWLESRGEVFTRIAGHDSGCTSYGVRVGGDRWFLKVAFGADTWQVDAAEAVHARWRHPAVVPLAGAAKVGTSGRAVAYPWRDGGILNDPFAGPAGDRHAPDSTMRRFARLPAPELLQALGCVIDAHVAAAAAGLVAVDFYDGCMLYDFGRREMHLVDVDLYREPYVLESDRQFGSSRFMAPEESRRGARIDERTTVYTLGRTARVVLGEPGSWRGGRALEAVVERATQDTPADRYPTVAAFAAAWGAGTGSAPAG